MDFQELDFRASPAYFMRNSKSILRTLREKVVISPHLTKKIAVLGGSTVDDYINILEIFLLKYKIIPRFYLSEYNSWFADGMNPPTELLDFAPDIVYIHTGFMNIENKVCPGTNRKTANDTLNAEFLKFSSVWQKLTDTFKCVIIQNNFEYPDTRVMGNRECFDPGGMVNFVNKLNLLFAEYAENHSKFFINDINYISGRAGLHAWHNPVYRNMYKLICAPVFIPDFCHNLACIIKSICALNKKALVTDLDNTLWGKTVLEDGVQGVISGTEIPEGIAYNNLQEYLLNLKKLGVFLAINSKNEPEDALLALEKPENILHKDDFSVLKINFENKDQNILKIADALNVFPDSIVFIDDSPAEREIVRTTFENDVETPPFNSEDSENYSRLLDLCGYFETTTLSSDDFLRTQNMKAETERENLKTYFSDFSEYLKNLNMKADIKPFVIEDFPRIAQLIGKSNRFNLTTVRYAESDIEKFSENPSYICKSVRLSDKFSSYGLVSTVVAKITSDNSYAHILLWVMSCRVLKKTLENALLESLLKECKKRGIKQLVGYYIPSPKNNLVKDFYSDLGFIKPYVNNNIVSPTLFRKNPEGYVAYVMDIPKKIIKNEFIEIIETKEQL